MLEEPSRFDDLQRLIHHGRRIDRNLGAHVPGWDEPTPGPRSTCCQSRLGTSRCRNGPPLAVSRMRATSRLRSAGRPDIAWNTALCSLSTGNSWLPAVTLSQLSDQFGPPITSVSLFARATVLPAVQRRHTCFRQTGGSRQSPPPRTSTSVSPSDYAGLALLRQSARGCLPAGSAPVLGRRSRSPPELLRPTVGRSPGRSPTAACELA